MKKIIKLAVFLSLVCVASSALLSYVNSITAPTIAKNQVEATDRMLKEIENNADEFVAEEIKEGSIVNVYFAKKDGETINTIYELSFFGFQSQITILVAISNDGEFSGFQVVEQAETPGYGTQIEEEPFMSQFDNKTIDDQIDIIAGSTVSTLPLQVAVDEAVAHFRANNK